MKTRDYKLDNTKALLMFLVIFVHMPAMIRRVYDTQITYHQTMYVMTCICSFHMPLFMMLSGYFSKKVEKSFLSAGKLFRIYLFTQAYFMVYYMIVRHEAFSIKGMITPRFSLWYLFALILMRLALPLITRWKYSIFVVAGVSIFFTSFTLSDKLDKALLKFACFFIFFMVGFYLQEEQIKRISSHRWLCLAGLVIGFASLGIISHACKIPMYKFRLLELHQDAIPLLEIGTAGYVIAIYLMILAIVLSLCVIGLMPDAKCIFSSLGKNSLSIYILQAFMVVFLTFVLEHLPLYSPYEPQILSLICAVAGLFLFGARPLHKAITFLTGGFLHLPVSHRKEAS